MNIAQIVQLASIVSSLLPVVGTMVQAVETTMPAGTPGAAKLEAVRAGIQSIYQASTDVTMQFEQLWPVLQTMITSLVAAYNLANVFKKQSTTPAA